LRSVGLWPGVVVERLASAPFGGPLLFRLHGYRLALRREEAQRVALQDASSAESSTESSAAKSSAAKSSANGGARS
ncbi:MAG: ferrous iron transport protein A, partial [Planctomycetota bacterium]